MPRRPFGDQAMTDAERKARMRERVAQNAERLRILEDIVKRAAEADSWGECADILAEASR